MKPQIAKEKWHRSYSKVTRNIVKQLKSRRKEKKEQLQLKWSKKEEELNSELGKGVTKTEKQIAKNNLVSDRLKDFAKEDNALTIEEYKLIEVHKEKVHEESGEKINIHALLDDIHEEFEKERLVLRQETNNEKIRQGQVLQQQKQKKKDSYVHRNISNKGGNGKEPLSKQKDFDAELDQISDTHNNEREKFILMMDIEQARQRQVLQKRLASKRNSRRLSEAIK